MFTCVSLCTCMHVHMSQWVGGLRTTYRSQFFTSTFWVQTIKLKLSGSIPSTYTAPVPGDLLSSSGLCGHQAQCGKQICRQKQSFTLSKNLFFKKDLCIIYSGPPPYIYLLARREHQILLYMVVRQYLVAGN